MSIAPTVQASIKESSDSSTMALMKDVLPKAKREEYLKLANPIAYVTEKFPPCFIMTSNEDFLREQPETFKKKLEECGVPYKYMHTVKSQGNNQNYLGFIL